MRWILCVLLGLVLGGCASVSPMMDSDATVEIEYENLPVYSQGGQEGEPTGYESYVSRCRAAIRTPAKNENVTLDMHLEDDCQEARLRTKASVSDPTHAQSVAGDVEEARSEERKALYQAISDLIRKFPGLVP